MYCEKCGSELTKIKNFHKCGSCGFEKYENAIPVVVPLVKVQRRGRDNDVSLLGTIRGIQPQKGKVAFPGGFQEVEDVKTALHREFLEETGMDLHELFGTTDIWEEEVIIRSTPDGRRNLMFFRCKFGLFEDQIDFSFRNEENHGFVLVNENTNLAFPLHQQQVKWGLQDEHES